MRVRLIDMAVVLAVCSSLAACAASPPNVTSAQNATSRVDSGVADGLGSCPLTDGFGPDDIPDYGQHSQWTGNPC